MKDKTTAALLAFFLGGVGVHKFYLGQTGAGIVYLIFCWTLIPAFIAFIEFIILLAMDSVTFDRRFNYMHQPMMMQAPPQQNIIIHNLQNAGAAPPQGYPQQQYQQQPVQQPGFSAQPPQPTLPEQQAAPALPPAQAAPQSGVGGVADELKKLNDLRVAGVITEEEFLAHKQKLLS